MRTEGTPYGDHEPEVQRPCFFRLTIPLHMSTRLPSGYLMSKPLPLRSAPKAPLPAPVSPMITPAGVQRVPIDRIHLWPAQPRRQFAESTLIELADSIQQNGLLSPLLVRPLADGWQIVAGERRWRAAQRAGLTEVPVMVRPMDDAEALVLALVENLQREDLNLMDRARALRRLHEQLGSWDAVGAAVGFGPARVDGMVKPLTERRMFQLNALNDLPAPLQEAIERGEMSEKHGRALGRVKDPAEQELIFDTIRAHDLSGGETELLLRLLHQEPDSDEPRADVLARAVDRLRDRRPPDRVLRSLHERIADTAFELDRLLRQSERLGPAVESADPTVEALSRLEVSIRDWRRSKGLKRRMSALPPGLGE